MPNEPTKQDTGKTLTLSFDSAAVDLFSDRSYVESPNLARGENLRLNRGPLQSRPGGAKLTQFSDVTHSRTFGTTGKYATISAAAQLLIPYGGFALNFHLTALRAAANGQILDGQDGADSVPPLKLVLTTAGVLTLTVNWDDASSSTISSSALSDGLDVHGLIVFDSVLGTLTMYVNGSSVGTPVTGLSATLRPVQTASMAWIIGVHKSAVPAYTLPFAGKIDSLTLFSLAGTRPASGGTTLVETLRRASAHAWANPDMGFVLFHYDMDETSGTTMYDRSRFTNNGVYTGSPASTDPVALSAIPTNYVGVLGANGGARYDVVGNFGRLFYQPLQAAVA